MKISVSDAFLDGWFAHKLGLFMDDNPYNKTTQLRSHTMWSEGWNERLEEHQETDAEEFLYDFNLEDL